MMLMGWYALKGKILALDFLNFTTHQLESFNPREELFFNNGDLPIGDFKDQPKKLVTQCLITLPNSDKFIMDPRPIGQLPNDILAEVYLRRTLSLLSLRGSWLQYFEPPAAQKMERYAHPLTLGPVAKNVVPPRCPDSFSKEKFFENRPVRKGPLHAKDARIASDTAHMMFRRVGEDAKRIDLPPDPAFCAWREEKALIKRYVLPATPSLA